MDVFELTHSVVAAKPSKLHALFLQLSDHKQAAHARRQRRLQQQQQQQSRDQGSEPLQQQDFERTQRQGSHSDHQHQQQEQAATSTPAPTPELRIPSARLPLLLAHLLPASGLQQQQQQDGAEHVAPSDEDPAHTRCMLRDTDVQLLQAVLLLDRACERSQPDAPPSQSTTAPPRSKHAASIDHSSSSAPMLAIASISERVFLSRLQSTSRAAKRAAALHRCGLTATTLHS